MCAKQKNCKKRPIVSGIILLGIGLLMLLSVQGILTVEQGWPLIIIVVGLAIVVAAMTRDKKPAPPENPPAPHP